jgi:hypothetical protein
VAVVTVADTQEADTRLVVAAASMAAVVVVSTVVAVAPMVEAADTGKA